MAVRQAGGWPGGIQNNHFHSTRIVLKSPLLTISIGKILSYIIVVIRKCDFSPASLGVQTNFYHNSFTVRFCPTCLIYLPLINAIPHYFNCKSFLYPRISWKKPKYFHFRSNSFWILFRALLGYGPWNVWNLMDISFINKSNRTILFFTVTTS